jgi:hypothetical protein
MGMRVRFDNRVRLERDVREHQLCPGCSLNLNPGEDVVERAVGVVKEFGGGHSIFDFGFSISDFGGCY